MFLKQLGGANDFIGPGAAVSRSEAGQHKALLVLDHTWREVPGERIPLTIGPRHYSAVGAGSPALAGLKPGDRCASVLHMSCHQNPGQEIERKRHRCDKEEGLVTRMDPYKR